MKSTIQEFKNILTAEATAQIVPFLKSLNAIQKEEIAMMLPELEKEYYTQVADSANRNDFKATETQENILSITFFVLYTRAYFQKSHQNNIIHREVIDTILPWYCPDWFSDYINDYSYIDEAYPDENDMYFDISYDWYMNYVTLGYIKSSANMIAKLLPRAITAYDEDYELIYRPEKLLKRELTLQQHIWYLFEFETRISVDYKLEEAGDSIWENTFINYISSGKIERSRFLRETLTGAARNFNPSLSGWYINLYSMLQPSLSEMLLLKKELLTLLDSTTVKVVTTVLKSIEQIAAEDEFEVSFFLDRSSNLLTLNVKKITTSVLLIFEKLVEKYPEHTDRIYTLTHAVQHLKLT